MKPKPFEIIVEFTPQSTKTGITYEAHQKGSLIRRKDCRWWWEGMRVCALKEHLVDGVCAVLCMEDDFCSRAEPKETT